MKLFQQRTRVQTFCSAKAFAEEYHIGEKDFILASRNVYESYFAPLGLKAYVIYKSKYGAGEPTDTMIDGLLADFRQTVIGSLPLGAELSSIWRKSWCCQEPHVRSRRSKLSILNNSIRYLSEAEAEWNTNGIELFLVRIA